MYFNERMFNQRYVNPVYFNQIQKEISKYNFEQDVEVMKAVHAVSDMCKAVKKMDDQHQQQAFIACLDEMAKELGW